MRISIQFSPTRVVEYSMEEMGHVELAYATTVHKAQGSEFDVVLYTRIHFVQCCPRRV